MIFETSQDTYNAYTKFLKKKEYKKAYRCLEKMLQEFPNDTDLLMDIIKLCLTWDKPEYGKQWMLRLTNIRSLCSDYLLISQMEAELDNIPQARIKKSGGVENAKQASQQFDIPSYNIPVKIRPFEEGLFAPLLKCDISPLKECQLFIDYTHLTLQGGFDELLCLNAIRGMDKYWYQIETARLILPRAVKICRQLPNNSMTCL